MCVNNTCGVCSNPSCVCIFYKLLFAACAVNVKQRYKHESFRLRSFVCVLVRSLIPIHKLRIPIQFWVRPRKGQRMNTITEKIPTTVFVNSNSKHQLCIAIRFVLCSGTVISNTHTQRKWDREREAITTNIHNTHTHRERCLPTTLSTTTEWNEKKRMWTR